MDFSRYSGMFSCKQFEQRTAIRRKKKKTAAKCRARKISFAA
jgi:hypothetical protein